jgi:hypothetical protein
MVSFAERKSRFRSISETNPVFTVEMDEKPEVTIVTPEAEKDPDYLQSRLSPGNCLIFIHIDSNKRFM